jgi:SAM-dependent methyltransferase
MGSLDWLHVSETPAHPERKRREADFHNEEFSHSSREKALHFYSVAQPAMDFFQSEIMRRASGKTVLEYGCGPGTHSFRLAMNARWVIGIDISQVAIEQARERARTRGAGNVEFHVMDAERLTFPDATFDLVCGRAIVHHLDVHRCFSTVARVLKPGGAALFQEPLGHNPLIELYRRRTPAMRTVDEHPLLMSDLAAARSYFDQVRFRPFVLSSLMAAFFSETVLFRPAFWLLSRLDSALFLIPFLRRFAWTSIWTLEGPKRPRP